MSFLEKLNRPAAVAVVLVAFLILDGLLFYRYQHSLRSAQNSAALNAPAGGELAEETTTTTASIAEETTTASSPPPEEQNNNEVGLQVVVAVVNTPVGLSIQADGQLVHEQVNSPGYSEEFEAEQAIDITAADGGAVLVGVDGEDLEPLGESGQRVRRTFTKDSQSQ